MTTDEIRVAVVTGRHAYDVVAFQYLWRSLPGVDAYPQHMEAYVADLDKVRAWYDVVVFYNYHQALPGEGAQGPEREMRRVLERLGESEQGIVLLHHALVAFLDWPWWSELCGIQERVFKAHKEQTVCVEVADRDHPIMQGVAASGAWEMVDETYAMKGAGTGCHVLLATEHPRSLGTLAWTRVQGRARVFCYQSGHDRQAYDDPYYRTVLARGVRWAARRL